MITSDARVSPVFRYKNAARAIEWLEQAFGFQTHERHANPDGTIAHAELRLGSGAIGLSSAGPVVPDNPWSLVRSGVYVCLADVDGMYNSAREAKADIAQTLRDTNYGAREFSARDLEGHLWSFGTYGMAAPAGEASVHVELRYDDGARALEWLPRAFKFTKGPALTGPDGTIARAQLFLGRDIVMLSSSPLDKALWRDQRQAVTIRVEDPDAHQARALEGGATILRPPHTTAFGGRTYYASDLEGFLWGFTSDKLSASQSPSPIRQ